MYWQQCVTSLYINQLLLPSRRLCFNGQLLVCLYLSLCDYNKTNKHIFMKCFVRQGLTKGRSDEILGMIRVMLWTVKNPIFSTVPFCVILSLLLLNMIN